MPEFIAIVNHIFIRDYNIKYLDYLLYNGKINNLHYNYLLDKTQKFFITFNHKGAIFREENEYFFISFTTINQNIEKVKSYKESISTLNLKGDNLINLIKISEEVYMPMKKTSFDNLYNGNILKLES